MNYLPIFITVIKKKLKLSASVILSMGHIDSEELEIAKGSADEITVKIAENNTITVDGKQEEKQDKYGYISRHLVRKFILPNAYDFENIQPMLLSDGVLTITATKHKTEKVEAKTIPIEQTGLPAKHLQNMKLGKEDH
ncbi:heat shock protein hsp-12.2-related [Holotrichia oblita]|uniref:Heat shock protein hsp-12.2-related n=1 Tax=Holotrichia oblita TaxID=644536 RepID=A0ACB9T3T7_HOLOL|nr:heat shock protein hsp-12.2-related [Holotrichia oblita]